jgi:phytoene dehydrogenase-like protein
VLLHHVFGEVNGKKGAWGHAVGGMGAITSAMREACIETGVEISTNAAVAQLLVSNGRATGVQLGSGDKVFGKSIAANVGPKLLFDRLIAQNDLPADFQRHARGYKTGSGTFRMNVALSELPRFTCLPEPGEHHQSGIIIAPTLDYMDKAYVDARAFGWSKAPIVEMLIPSTVDDSLAPKGQHVASLFCQQFAPHLPDGRSWMDEREAAAEVIIDTVNHYATNFKASVLGSMILSPQDLETTFGLVDGDIMHGHMSIDQLWSARPLLGHGDYRGPIKGLYMCGAGTHPGGGVTGAPGHNAAQEILADRSLMGRLLR